MTLAEWQKEPLKGRFDAVEHKWTPDPSLTLPDWHPGRVGKIFLVHVFLFSHPLDLSQGLCSITYRARGRHYTFAVATSPRAGESVGFNVLAIWMLLIWDSRESLSPSRPRLSCWRNHTHYRQPRQRPLKEPQLHPDAQISSSGDWAESEIGRDFNLFRLQFHLKTRFWTLFDF